MNRHISRIAGFLHMETFGLHPRLQVVSLAASLLPRRRGGHARARALALAGGRVGEGTVIHGFPRISGQGDLMSRLVIGKHCSVAPECVFDLEECINIGDRVTIGPGAMILTSTHELASADHRAGALTRAPVVLKNGVWVGARSIILPGVTLGEGVVVEAGAVVNKDVAPNTRVGGIPATQLELMSTP